MNWLFPLRRIIPLTLLVFSLPLAALVHLMEMHQAERAIEQQLEQLAAHSGNQLTTVLRDSLRRNDWETSRRVMQSVVTLPDLRWAALVDDHNYVLLSTDYRQLGRLLQSLSDAPPSDLVNTARNAGVGEHIQTGARERTWAAFPVTLPPGKDELRSNRIGLLILALDNTTQRQKARDEALRNAATSFVGTLLLAGLLWWYLNIAVVRRIERLTAAIHHWRQYQGEIPYIGGRDEIAQLAHQFTTLTRELAGQNRQLRAFFERSYQFMALLSPDGTLLEVNDLALEFIGTTRAAVVGRLFWETPWWNHDTAQQEQLQNDTLLAAAGEHIQRQVTHRTPDGVLHTINFSLRAIRNPGGKVEWLLAEGHDVTALIAAEQQARRLSAFYSTLSHTNATIVRCTSQDELLPRICSIVVEHGGLLGAWIGQIDEPTTMIQPIANAGVDPKYLNALHLSTDPRRPEGAGPTGTAIREGRHYICNDFLAAQNTTVWHEWAVKLGFRSSAAFPLYRGGRVFGSLNLYAGEAGLFTDDLIALLDEMAVDISFALDNLQREEELKLAATVFDSSREIIVITDANTNIISVNRAFSEISGYDSAEVIGQNIRILKSGRQDASFYDAMWKSIKSVGYWQGELWNRRKDGEVYPAWVSISAVRNEGNVIEKYISVSTDITEFKQAEDRIRYLAYYDPLTDLPNRTLLRDRTEQVLHNASRERRQAALLFLDLDNFKNINDSLGHLSGDELLQEVAKRIQSELRQSDTVGRLGGDEFLILLADVNVGAAMHVARNLLNGISRPFTAQGHTLTVSASIGIALFPRDGNTFEELHKNADIAMYKAKELGRNRYHFFTQELNSAAMERLVLENALRRALDENQLNLHFQPQVEIASGRIIGTEALLRWNHPELGSVSPAKFIPVAEESGLIGPIGAWVVREACRQNKAWQDAGLPPMVVAVNTSTRQYSMGDVYAMVSDALQSSGLDPRYLEVEITESLLAQDIDATLDVLTNLKALGVQIAVDDFGTGYSSLAYLKRFPLNKLKIDQSFVRDLDTDEDDRAIAAGVINLGHSLQLTAIAEGVETEQQLETLRTLGCDEAQGYLFSRPLPPEELERLLRSRLESGAA